MAELDTDLVDFFRIRTVERMIVHDPDRDERGWVDMWRKPIVKACGKKITWPNGDKVTCHLETDGHLLHIGRDHFGHERAFLI